MNTYDIVVIGGGHAGTEAAWTAARMGCSVALVTMSPDAIGRMSCNPAIGGLGKGHMVREIDALGGLMGLATDAGGIQFRLLNRRKGPAVRAPRAQADRKLYASAVQRLIADCPNLEVIEGLVDQLVVSERHARIRGVRLQDGRELACEAAVVTTGTFLRGLMHCGEQQTAGGRVGEQAAVTLSDDLQRLGFALGRLKTGTPPRIDRDSIDFSRLATQPGDDPPVPFSFMTDALKQPQVDCWITHTNAQTHELIRGNLDRAPMYSGQIQSHGPRYCPSIEDKVVRFAEKESHQIFLEPEGYDSTWIYCNGISTSLPKDVQEPLVRSIVGLESAKIVQHGYAVEYDWVPTDQIQPTLETRRVAGLYLAGQINGTSGYEEAAGQGLLAGANAALKLRGEAPLILGRDEAYLGVMIDDLVTRPPDEPYRMFTSRAEYRLHLRSDNADQRLTPIGRRIGLVDDTRWRRFEHKRESIVALTEALHTQRHEGKSLAEWLRRPEINFASIAQHASGFDWSTIAPDIIDIVEIGEKYAGYLEREKRQIERYRHMEARGIPESFEYVGLAELRHEAREKLSRFRPRSIGQAARISGISPADIATLSVYLSRQQRRPTG